MARELPDSPPRSANHWSDYWASGALTSLPQDFAFNYDGEVERFWHEQFDTLPESGKMLDICTGNGAIALLAAAWAAAQDRTIEIAAVDAADIRPDAIARRRPDVAELVEGIQFHGRTSVEALPFEDQSFDLVTSQYGLEYCRLDTAAGELARVIRPGGCLAVLAHEASTEVIETMAEEERAYQLLESVRFFRVLRSWVKGQLAPPDFRQRLEGIQRRLREEVRRAQSPLIGQVGQSVASLLPMSAAELRENREAVGGFLGRMESGRDRLLDMLRVNRRIAGNPDWHRPLADAGFEYLDSYPMVYRGQHPMGQCWLWTRSA